MRRALLTLVAAGLFLTSVPARPYPLPRPIVDNESNCTLASLFPAAAAVPYIDSADVIDIDLFLVGDRGISTYRMEYLVTRMAKAYQPLGLKLDVVGSREVILEGTDPKDLLTQAKSLFPESSRPVGSDAVLLFTSVDIGSGPNGSSVAGQADCVGGILFPTKSFVVIEDDEPTDDNWTFGPVGMSGEKAAKIATHELAHLLGAHHQYANCVEGIPSEMDRSEVSPCTAMFNDVGLVSLAFGVLEASVVRGYAEAYARP